jgi:dephospho-CoA kinase
MIVIGLTGSIGMGKSTTAQMFEERGVPVYDADAEVRALYAAGGAAVGPIETAFPGVSRDGAIDRGLLGDRVLGKPEALERLNQIVWPMMGAARQAFFQRARDNNTPMVVLDVPLLLETGGEKNVDAVVVVSAPHYATTDGKGRFNFRSLEPGKYRMRVWNERGDKAVTQEITIKPDRNTVTVSMAGATARGALADKFGAVRGAKP